MPISNEENFKSVTINDVFWKQYQNLVNDVVIPYQWKALNDQLDDAEPSHAIENFEIAAGIKSGEFYGMVFQDSDVAKWLEAVAYALSQRKDAALASIADEVIRIIGQSQLPNGYLNTYFTVKEPEKKWSNLCECHELYCAGHMIEAGVAYFYATGKRQLLDIVCRFADHIEDTFGDDSSKLQGFPGHPEIELALARLYEVTQEERYKSLCQFFVEIRGRGDIHYFDDEYDKRGKTSFWNDGKIAWMVEDKAYSQSHLPVELQSKAIGHAVRFVYLYAGVAHLARLTQDREKFAICHKLWRNMVDRQMYVTGAIGSQSEGESFSVDYDLPNDTAYTETCASIGLMMFANRMLQIDPDAEYADVMERALYNTVIAGMALDGKHFFYVNPLEVHPDSKDYNHIYDHVKTVRQRWFGCACCPPNVARLLGSIGNYIYTVSDHQVSINLYISNEADFSLSSGELSLEISGDYAWQGQSQITVTEAPDEKCCIALRKPNWSSQTQIMLNGTAVTGEEYKGYLKIERVWKAGDVLALSCDMNPIIVRSNPLVRQNANKLALQRGPFVYCMEQADNGSNLHNIKVDSQADFECVAGEGLFEGHVLIHAQGVAVSARNSETESLYTFNQKKPPVDTRELTFIPYFSWANRGEGEMRVWVNEL